MAINYLKKLFGTKSEREIKSYYPIVDQINAIYETLRDKPDEAFIARTQEFKDLIQEKREQAFGEAKEKNLSKEEGEDYVIQAEYRALDEILPEAFAVVKETCRRLVGKSWKVVGQLTLWEMIPYDVQLIGAIVLHKGKITEMKTGEGKTLVATMPLYLNALTGRGVHVVTVNDYLAQRDSEWMGKIYENLGLTVGAILNQMDNDQRREIYHRDITYGTNNEFGFDYLRDNMGLSKEEQAQRGHFYAIIDEVDSILIDEARTPLIISGAVEHSTDSKYRELKPQVEALVRKQTALVNNLVADAEKFLAEDKDYEAGLKLLQAMRGTPKNRRLQKVFQESGTKKLALQVEADYMRDQRLHEVDEELYFSTDEKSHVIDLTEKGRQTLSPNNPEAFVIPDLGELVSEIEHNERLSPQEKVKETEKARLLHSNRSEQIHNITQLLRAYSLYEKDVEYVMQEEKVLIVDEFTGRILPGRRFSDGLHQALEAKENVKIERETQTLATITIQNYFRLYKKLAGMTGTAETEAEELHSIYGLDVTVIPTHKLAIREDFEDLIYKTKREKYQAILDEIAEKHVKGQPVLVGTISVDVSETISRMLTRRGIPHNVLNAKQHQREAEIVVRAGQRGAVTIATNMAGRGTDIKLGEGVRELGGLHILGTERHEARRIDLQLKGRSGRQGDPGSSQFNLSLEDDLMRLFGSERIASIMDRLGVQEGEVITHQMVTKSIERAQKKVEARNFAIRKRLLEYDDVMNQQREVIYTRRTEVLQNEDIRETVHSILKDTIEEVVETHTDPKKDPIDWDWEGIETECNSILTISGEEDWKKGDSPPSLSEDILKKALQIYNIRESLVPQEIIRAFERYVVLRTIDEKWRDHLYAMDQLREGINLRAYGQKDPLLEYKSEGFNMFVDMLNDMNRETIQRLFRTQLQGMDRAPALTVRQPRNLRIRHDEAMGMGYSLPIQTAKSATDNGDSQSPVSRQAYPQQNQGKMQPVNVEKKIGRNEPCPCGSGKKYKKCHGR